MSYYEKITLVLSGFAVLFSVIALIQNNRLAKKQFELDKKQSELADKQLSLIKQEEMAKSKTLVQLTISNNFGSDRLIIKNIGESKAFDIEFNIIPREGNELPIDINEYSKIFPLSKLDPEDKVELMWLIDGATGTSFDSISTWKNEDGSNGKKETILFA